MRCKTFFLMIAALFFMTAGSAFAQKISAGNTQWSSPDFAIPGSAQQSDSKTYRDADPLKNPVFLDLSREMQDELLAESQKFNDECQTKTTYAQKHDCACLSVHFLNERLKFGPDKPYDTINMDIMSDCVDKPATAGYAFNKCMSLYSGMFPGDLKSLCECYARRFTQSYAAKPSPNADYEMNLGINALGDCRKIQSGQAVPDVPATVDDAERKEQLLNLKP